MKSYKTQGAIIVLLACCPGCLTLFKDPTKNCQPEAQGGDGQTIRVKAPPQKIIIEQPECAPASEAPKGQGETTPESNNGRPETSRQPQRRPESEGEQEGALGTLAALGQVASLSRTSAITRSLGTVNPGASALGIGITWIHIPIPLPRLFCVDETPTVTVPLSEANLMPVGYREAYGTYDARQGGRGTLSRDEIGVLVAQELAAQRQRASHQEAAPQSPTTDDAERRRLEKKLSDAEAQIDNLSKVLKSLDDKIPAKTPSGNP